ncbi:ferritin-like domain-containing protein [Sphingomonas jeddahensis]|uniref:Ferritin-like domain protein n=1 Tax=Sphingomonas jeddahensis TaxID=1915074 RepID=A0A1V2ES62_9SPHN|nr:ferritin-like domain-containing protein [Sphingomonas jeddahensis]ONF95516.1 hypothetical protein SPHI_21830 [Sphingomonas jeddahensis]
MIDQDTIPPMLDAAASRRAERRRFLQLAGGASVAAGGLALLSACGGGGDDDDDSSPTPSPSPSPTPTSTGNADRQVLNFALQLEYLQAQYFAYATTGAGIDAALLTGTGTAGTVTGGAAVPFADPFIAAFAREIAADARARVAFLRDLIKTEAVAQPAINLSGAADGAFTAAARTAGVVGGGELFNPFANDRNFLLGAFLLQDLIVTAYKPLVSLANAAATRNGFIGITTAQSYHAGTIRTALYANADWRADAGKFSNYRDTLNGGGDVDQGVASTDGAANITPADSNGIAYSRASGSVLNILYQNKAAVSAGGFFPAGFNGDLKTSNAN